MHQKIKSSLGLLITAFLFSGLLQANTLQADAPDKQPSKLAARQQQLSVALEGAEKASWIAEGNGAHILYVFFDPNCPYCHKLYERLRSRVGQNELQVRWIPVGILFTTSLGKAAALLEAQDPLLAFRQNEEKFTHTEHGAASETFASAATEKKLKQNSQLLQQIGGQSVPTILYREASGLIKVRQGAPSQKKLDAFLAQVAS